MKHWIVKVSQSNTGEQYAHLETDTPPSAGDPLASGRVSVVELDVGPHDTAEDAWIEWHKKRQRLLPKV